VFSDRENGENRELAGKLNYLGNKREVAGNLTKKVENPGIFIQYYIIFEKENFEVCFCPFLHGKNKTLKKNNLHNIFPKLYFFAGRVQI